MKVTRIDRLTGLFYVECELTALDQMHRALKGLAEGDHDAERMRGVLGQLVHGPLLQNAAALTQQPGVAIEGDPGPTEQVAECLEEALGGPQFKHDVRVVYVRMLGKAMARMRSALEPFAIYAGNNVDEEGWKGGRGGRDRIVDWFGPSEFRAAREAFDAAPPQQQLEQSTTGKEDCNA